MIVNDKDAVARLNSPMNLINRLTGAKAKNSAMSLFGIGGRSLEQAKPAEGKKESSSTAVILDEESKFSFNPFRASPEKKQEPITGELVTTADSAQLESSPSISSLLQGSDDQIKLGLAHDTALKLLNDSTAMLATKLDDIKADKLPSVISAASKVVESIRRERNEVNKNSKGQDVHYHFYTPIQKKLDDYEVSEVA